VRQLQRNLRREVQVVADASGVASATINVTLGPSYEVHQITVYSDSTLIPIATTYVGTNDSGVQISQTLYGKGDTDSAPRTTLRSGESLTCVWTGCTVGANCRMTVIGDEVGY
jgi:hypothetical protein